MLFAPPMLYEVRKTAKELNIPTDHLFVVDDSRTGESTPDGIRHWCYLLDTPGSDLYQWRRGCRRSSRKRQQRFFFFQAWRLAEFYPFVTGFQLTHVGDNGCIQVSAKNTQWHHWVTGIFLVVPRYVLCHVFARYALC